MTEALDLTAAINAASAALAAEDGASWGYDHSFEVSAAGRGDAGAAAFARAAVVAAAPHILDAAGKIVSEDQCRQIMQAELERGTRPAMEAHADRIEEAARFSERKRVLDAARNVTVLMTRGDGAEVAAVQWSALLEALGLKP